MSEPKILREVAYDATIENPLIEADGFITIRPIIVNPMAAVDGYSIPLADLDFTSKQPK